MIKTELMLEYERQTRETLDMSILKEDASGSWYGYIDMVDAKATAYDRLMSGGKKTPKEVANFFDLPIAQDKEGFWYAFGSPPVIDELRGTWGSLLGYEKEIPSCNIRYTGDWKNSLTLPDGWEAK